MNINSAKFEISNSDVNKCPATTRHEYAFIGRSNVGKSSLINMLTGRKGLAMTSSTPGKTTLINHFLINDEWYIVDLPGYGYAQRGKQMQAQIKRIIEDYILQRGQMTCLFVLIDSRHDPQKIDMQFLEWLGENEVPFAIVFTKLDKLSSTAGKIQTKKYLDTLREQWEELPPVFYTSSSDGRGRKELLDYIEELNKLPIICEE
ncbi:MAG: YihA family ribosome biogenesis GTP-binding protein [Candidatus Homeothermus sp.]|jgi:ribosome biogenesis GTP-binding protein ysxC|nr:YihA family ribosome biogenesis GTP-binding protein [Candidatus Homeothermus sp.]PWL61926.1 MAG: YihA family ribosome biogenesis GTP-binding protein [Bacteroidales bacterium]